MEVSELIEYLAEGIKGGGINSLAAVFAAIADKAGMPIKSMRLTFRESPVSSVEVKFPKPNEE